MDKFSIIDDSNYRKSNSIKVIINSLVFAFVLIVGILTLGFVLI